MTFGTYLPLAVGIAVALLLTGLGLLLLIGGARGQDRQTELFDERRDYPA
jgi:hypothetical protein